MACIEFCRIAVFVLFFFPSISFSFYSWIYDITTAIINYYFFRQSIKLMNSSRISLFFSMNCCFTARCHQYSHLILYSLCVYSTSCTFVLLRLFWFFLSTLSTCVCGLIRLFDAPGLLNELSVWTHIHETHAHTDNNWPKNQIYEREKEKKNIYLLVNALCMKVATSDSQNCSSNHPWNK